MNQRLIGFGTSAFGNPARYDRLAPSSDSSASSTVIPAAGWPLWVSSTWGRQMPVHRKPIVAGHKLIDP